MFITLSELIADYHVLHRLLSPRHPPYALNLLTIYHKVLSAFCCFDSHRRAKIPAKPNKRTGYGYIKIAFRNFLLRIQCQNRNCFLFCHLVSRTLFLLLNFSQPLFNSSSITLSSSLKSYPISLLLLVDAYPR